MNGNVWMIVVAAFFVAFAIFYWNSEAKRCNKCKRKMRYYKGSTDGVSERTYYCRWCKSSACIKVIK